MESQTIRNAASQIVDTIRNGLLPALNRGGSNNFDIEQHFAKLKEQFSRIEAEMPEGQEVSPKAAQTAQTAKRVRKKKI